jgi:hypothetical protein
MTSIFLLYVIGSPPSWDIFGRIFIGFFLMVQNHYRDLCFLLQMSMTYHPQMDGQTKFLSRTLEETCLCYFIEEQPRTWYEVLQLGENTSTTSYKSAATALLLRCQWMPPAVTIEVHIRGNISKCNAQDLMDRDEAPRQLKLHLDRAQSHMTH